jgi:hypothetical protein
MAAVLDCEPKIAAAWRELAGMNKDAKRQLLCLLIDDLTDSRGGVIEVVGKLGPRQVFCPPENAKENARRMAESLSFEERAEIKHQLENPGREIPFDEIINVLPKEFEASVGTK